MLVPIKPEQAIICQHHYFYLGESRRKRRTMPFSVETVRSHAMVCVYSALHTSR